MSLHATENEDKPWTDGSIDSNTDLTLCTENVINENMLKNTHDTNILLLGDLEFVMEYRTSTNFFVSVNCVSLRNFVAISFFEMVTHPSGSKKHHTSSNLFGKQHQVIYFQL